MNLKTLTPNLIVENVNKSIEFYQNELGFTKVVSVPDEGELDFAIIKSDEVSIMLQSKNSFNNENPFFEKMNIGGTFVLYIDMVNINDFYRKIKDKVNIIVDMHKTFYGTMEFTIKDINEYLITFAETNN